MRKTYLPLSVWNSRKNGISYNQIKRKYSTVSRLGWGWMGRWIMHYLSITRVNFTGSSDWQRKICFSHSVHPFFDNTILPYIISKIYSRNLIYSLLVIENKVKCLHSLMGIMEWFLGRRNPLNYFALIKRRIKCIPKLKYLYPM